MSHHSQRHFITQYISLRCTAVNEFYQTAIVRALREDQPLRLRDVAKEIISRVIIDYRRVAGQKKVPSCEAARFCI